MNASERRRPSPAPSSAAAPPPVPPVRSYSNRREGEGRGAQRHPTASSLGGYIDPYASANIVSDDESSRIPAHIRPHLKNRTSPGRRAARATLRDSRRRHRKSAS